MNRQHFGAEYEIEVYQMSDEDMFDITTALHEAGVRGDDRDEIGIYLRDNKPQSIWVEPVDVAKAVEVINRLGFQTDEDEA